MVFSSELVKSTDDDVDRPARVVLRQVEVDQGPLPLSRGNELDHSMDVFSHLLLLSCRLQLDVAIAEEQVVMDAGLVRPNGFYDVHLLKLSVRFDVLTDA